LFGSNRPCSWKHKANGGCTTLQLVVKNRGYLHVKEGTRLGVKKHLRSLSHR